MRKHRLRDLGLEVLVGSAIVAAVILYAQFGPFRWMPALRWWGLAGETAVLFGYVGRAMRSYWKNRRFWAGFLGFLAAHLVVYVIVLLRVERFPLLWFVFVGYLEWVALAYLLDLVLRNHLRSDSRPWYKTF